MSKVYRVDKDGWGINIPSYFTLHIGDILLFVSQKESFGLYVRAGGVRYTSVYPFHFENVLYKIEYSIADGIRGIENVNIPDPNFMKNGFNMSLNDMIKPGMLEDITVAYTREKKLEDILNG